MKISVTNKGIKDYKNMQLKLDQAMINFTVIFVAGQLK